MSSSAEYMREYMREYRKSLPAKIYRMWEKMNARLSLQRGDVGANCYAGIRVLITKEEFCTFAESSEELKDLYNTWSLSGYKRKDIPCLSRINPDLNYTLNNIQFISRSEQSRRDANRLHGSR